MTLSVSIITVEGFWPCSLRRCFSSVKFADICSCQGPTTAFQTDCGLDLCKTLILVIFQTFCRRFAAEFGIIVPLHDPVSAKLYLSDRCICMVYRGVHDQLSRSCGCKMNPNHQPSTTTIDSWYEVFVPTYCVWFSPNAVLCFMFKHLHFGRVAGGLEPIPVVIGREVGYTLDRSPVHHRATQRQMRQTTMHAHTHS